MVVFYLSTNIDNFVILQRFRNIKSLKRVTLQIIRTKKMEYLIREATQEDMAQVLI